MKNTELNVIIIENDDYNIAGVIHSSNIQKFFNTFTESEESRTPMRWVESFHDIKGNEWGRRFFCLETKKIMDVVLAKRVASNVKKLSSCDN